MTAHPPTEERIACLERYEAVESRVVSDAELAAVVPAPAWRRFGLRGPVVVLRWFMRNALRIAVLVAGIVVLAAGLAMLVLPGPGIIVVILGLAILATEFAWAERALDRTAGTAAKAVGSLASSRTSRTGLAVSGLAMVTVGLFTMLTAERFWMAGIGAVLAGLAALSALHPGARRWMTRNLHIG